MYSDPINVEIGCTQGDTDSPIIFNIIIDAVLRSWKANDQYNNSQALFYADNGLLEHTEANLLQSDLDRIIKLFGKIGLKTNKPK